ncbi:hypothetical protein [Xanthocytophaga flava]|uniref:hypothetical protein n=1 Tax=Xanthocytophaga flava TaxID=3048013 RepID=UPI0028D43A15|nr:hypothetical protein [Xanthocytophaga flavus]MDJ1468184.1 hypothetical protein [Xanthocytophaga flavus]
MRILFIVILIVAITCIQFNQIMNLSLVLTMGGPDWQKAFGLDLKITAAFTWAIGIELGVLVSVLAGAKRQAMILALGSCLVNLLANRVIDYDWSFTAAKIVIYGLSSYLLWYFCELFALYYNNSVVNWFGSKEAEIQEKSDELTNTQITVEEKTSVLDDHPEAEPIRFPKSVKKPLVKSKLASSDQLICQYCQRLDFKNQSALNAHVGRCKQNPKAKHSSIQLSEPL